MIDLSLSEVEATARLATRGLGVNWACSDESGVATKRLCQYGLDGCKHLLAALAPKRVGGLETSAPMTLTTVWQAPSELMCPVEAGCALSDMGAVLKSRTLELTRVAGPALVLPFVVQSARLRAETLRLTWSEGEALTDGLSLSINGEVPMVPTDMTVAPTQASVPDAPLHARARTDAQTWSALQELAALTYAPATAQSRARGAGSGQSDVD